MRSEDQVLKQILDYAENDENIRAVMMNGSRVNPNIEKDIFCDYDIVYVVCDPKKFSENRQWIQYFGDLVILQFNRAEDDPENDFIFLMQFQDGVRIDLTFVSTTSNGDLSDDSLTLLLLDKDNRYSGIPAPNDSSYITKKPTQEEYDLMANEFWWVSTYIAKALWRNELVSAKYLFEVIVRDCLNKMINWYIAMQYDWQINVGKMGKNFEKLLPPDLWQELLATYPNVEEDEIWTALFKAGDFMRQVAIPVAQNLGYTYPRQDDERVSRYQKHVRFLPKDATSFD
jgi:aminoglycoside 6-adenylyltransferase